METQTPPIKVPPESPSASKTVLSEQAQALLKTLARRYVWWKTPEEAMLYPDRVAAQVMNLGTWDDLTAMAEATGEDYLREVLRHAEIGQLNPRSWHYRLGLAEYGVVPVPPMPIRKTA